MQSRHTFTGASYDSSTLAGDPFSAAGLSDLENRLVRRPTEVASHQQTENGTTGGPSASPALGTAASEQSGCCE